MKDPCKEAVPGDVLYGKKNLNKGRARPHYIIYLGTSKVAGTFLGAMLTHSSDFNNISLREEHFKKKDNAGNDFKVQYENSFIAGELLYKKQDWAPFTKHGELTKEGLEFVIHHIGHLIPKFSPLNRK